MSIHGGFVDEIEALCPVRSVLLSSVNAGRVVISLEENRRRVVQLGYPHRRLAGTGLHAPTCHRNVIASNASVAPLVNSSPSSIAPGAVSARVKTRKQALLGLLRGRSFPAAANPSWKRGRILSSINHALRASLLRIGVGTALDETGRSRSHACSPASMPCFYRVACRHGHTTFFFKETPMRSTCSIVPGTFRGATIEPGTFHLGHEPAGRLTSAPRAGQAFDSLSEREPSAGKIRGSAHIRQPGNVASDVGTDRRFPPKGHGGIFFPCEW
jgi:hypothetical protein